MPNYPVPTALKIVRGNPGKRKLNHSEPKTRRGAPDKPAFLIPEASAEWDRIVPILLEMNVLQICDGAALANYCMTFARWQEAEAAITKHGVVIDRPARSRNGQVVGHDVRQNPACAVAMALQKEMRAQLAAFGLDPTARARIKGATQERQENPLVALLKAQQVRRAQQWTKEPA